MSSLPKEGEKLTEITAGEPSFHFLPVMPEEGEAGSIHALDSHISSEER